MTPSPYRTSGAPVAVRTPGSVRRTCSIEADWPEGETGPTRLIGRARDARTPAGGGAPEILAEDRFEAMVARDRTILSIRATPDRPALQTLSGVRAGGHLRAAIANALPGERAAATPLYLLLDDIAGASLVAPWAWGQWSEAWIERRAQLVKTYKFADVCIGFRQGSAAIDTVRTRENPGSEANNLRNPADPEGWHPFVDSASPSFMRARWIDVSFDDTIRVASGFQDSANSLQGGRRGVHEYSLLATVDPATSHLLSIDPRPHILPYAECDAALATSQRLIGLPVGDLREAVLRELRGPMGCTHLNDALRALAEVGPLAIHLRTPASA